MSQKKIFRDTKAFTRTNKINFIQMLPTQPLKQRDGGTTQKHIPIKAIPQGTKQCSPEKPVAAGW